MSDPWIYATLTTIRARATHPPSISLLVAAKERDIELTPDEEVLLEQSDFAKQHLSSTTR